MKKYKALILDVDGTLIPNKIDGTPSEKIIKTINIASKFIHIGIATSRPLFMLSDIFNKLSLNGPSIISGGSQIIMLPEKKLEWEKMIDQKDLLEICFLLNKIKVPFLIHNCAKDQDIKFSKKRVIEKPGHVISFGIKEKTADDIINLVSHVPTVAAHKIPSWKKNKIDLMVTHSLATKQHAIFEVAKILNINTHEIIGIGDGYNDFPLLMACGLKVAMGNAVPDLKEIADYVAPSVENDGVADVIEKFVLNFVN